MIGKSSWSEARKAREEKRAGYNNAGWKGSGAAKRRKAKAERRLERKLAARGIQVKKPQPGSTVGVGA